MVTIHMTSAQVGRSLLLAALVATPSHRTPPFPPVGRSTDNVSFKSGDLTLAGTLYLPTSPGRHPAIVVLHASNGGTRDYHAYQHLARSLPPAGFAVLIYDRRGEGASTGTAGSATFRELASDGVAAVAYLETRSDIDRSRIGVWGVSQGGWLAPLAATMSPEISFVIAVSAPGVTPAQQMDYSATYALHAAGAPQSAIDRTLEVRGVVDQYFRGRSSRADAERAIGTIRQQPWFGQTFVSTDVPADPKQSRWYGQMDYDPLAVVTRVKVPILFFYAQDDAYVPVDESMRLVRKAARVSDITIRRIPGTDHFMETGKPLSAGPISRQYVDELLAWLRRPH